jgi:hypothetical protein
MSFEPAGIAAQILNDGAARTELTASVIDHRFFGDLDSDEPVFAVLHLSDGTQAVGEVDDDSRLDDSKTIFGASIRYRFFGVWEIHEKFGKRFKFEAFVLAPQTTQAGVIAFLSRSNFGISATEAGRIFKTFGDKSVERLREAPGVVAEACGIDEEVCQTAAIRLRESSKYEAAKIELFEMFAGRGFTRKTVAAAIREWKQDAPAVIRRDPLKMLVAKLPGVGFKRADKMYCDYGGNPGRLRRLMLAGWHWMATNSGGHTWEANNAVRREILKAVMATAATNGAPMETPLDESTLDRAVELGVRAKWLVMETATVQPKDDGEIRPTTEVLLAEAEKAFAESKLAEHIKRIRSYRPVWPTLNAGDGGISEHQAEKIAAFRHSAVAILAGTPGCLDGDTKLIYLRGKRNGGREITIADFYKKFNGIRTPTTPWTDLDELTYLHSLNPDGTVSYNQVVAVFDSGVKKTIRIGFSDGSFIRLTPDHPIATPGGDFVEAGSLSIGDKVLAKGSMKPVFCGGKDLAGRPHRIIVNTKYHPGNPKIVNGCSYVRVPRARLVVEAEMNGHDYEGFVYALKNDAEARSKFQFLPSHLEVHHKDEDTLNDTIGNLAVLSKKEHAKTHSKKENFNAEYTKEISVVSIGDEADVQTYDIQMTSPANNFAANGIIVHNTGKTFTGAAILRKLLERFPAGRIAVCAPTGKAAVRITSAMQRYDLPITATTIHRLLGVAGHRNGRFQFTHHDTNPISADVVVVDESSMLDTDLASALFAAIPSGGNVILLGDPYQLPPVGHGAPLRDLLAGGVPFGLLDEIKRNSGRIVQACREIKDGKGFAVSPAGSKIADGENLLVFPANDEAGQRDGIESLVRNIPAKLGYDPVWDVQVLVATNEKTEVSRKQLNTVLQEILNPIDPTLSPAARHPKYRIGDKIICLANTAMQTWELPPTNGHGDDIKSMFDPTAMSSWSRSTDADGAVYLANGDMGRVEATSPDAIIAKFTMPTRTVKIKTKKKKAVDAADERGGDDDSREFDLAYAVTVHKSQGSEWPVVIIVLDATAKLLTSREWLYTAISRASAACFMVGKMSTALKMSLRPSLDKRRTRLQELIAGTAD